MNNFDKLSKLHAECFPMKPWAASDFAELKKSGCEIIESENSFIVWRVAGDEAEIITIGVLPDARRTGIAGALIAFMENDVKKKNIQRIVLEVRADNVPAIKLYERNGFKISGIRPKYYDSHDGVIMAKDLTKE